MGQLITYTPKQISEITNPRPGETKLGECLQVLSSLDDLTAATKFVLLGLPEDIGVRANLGTGGAHTAWETSLRALLTIQSTDRLTGHEVSLLGYLDLTPEMTLADLYDLKTAEGLKYIRNLVSSIDKQVYDLIRQIVQAGKIPIVVGGGHNNSYPILKSLAKHHGQGVHTINIDAHADFRALEGRHSGNGFSYAMHEGYLAKYALIGLHENYNSQLILARLKEHPEQVFYTFFEDYLRRTRSYHKDFEQALHFTAGICGLEIDMDCMAGALASAGSLTGFSTNQVREMIAQTKGYKLAYFHIAEGALTLADGGTNPLTGKLIATLISDFLKAQS